MQKIDNMLQLSDNSENLRENMAIKKLSIDIKNCYGINEFIQDFELVKNNPEYRNERVIQIYAQNGTMKTSLTKCFKDYKDNLESKDRINNQTGTKLIKIDDIDINPEQIFVVDSNTITTYESPNISRLLLNNNLKKELDDIQAPIIEKENYLRNKINSLLENMPKGKSLLDDIAKALYPSPKSLPMFTYNGLKIIKDIIKDFDYRKTSEDEHVKYSNLDYYTLFHEKVFIALNKKGVQKAFSSYFTEYKQFVNNSKIFRFVENGTFDHLGAENIRKTLSLDNFFKAKHGITLSIKEEDKYSPLNISTDEELSLIIEKEKQDIETNENLAKSWKSVEAALGSNDDVRKFSSYIKNNIWLINDLVDLELLRRKVIASYFLMEREAYNDYIKIWEEQEAKIHLIREKAKIEKTRWDEVKNIFHNRFFHIPYEVKIDNTAPTILGEETAILELYHSSIKVEKNALINDILSEGEKRTLYLLNIIFDLLTLQEESLNQDKILVIDDIVDSFDYKNKHAILEYIYDITKEPNIYLIILTHSFDFYRSIANMFQLGYGYIAERNDKKISLEKYKEDDLNPCKSWLKIETSKDFISSMALIRNLCDYTSNNQNLKDKLNKMLHYPINNQHEDISSLYCDIKAYLNLDLLHTIDGINGLDKNITFYDNVINEADIITNNYNNEHLNLQNKVIIAIALRLLMENKMISYLNNKQVILKEKEFKYKQTRYLINKIKSNLTNIDDNIKRLLDMVNIISSNHIHINSFMYEPLLDIHGVDLIKRYQELKNVTLQ